MGKQRQKKRVKSRIDELPPELRDLIDIRLANVNITYREIADEVTTKGYDISKSSIGRYALRQGSALQRLKEAQEQTRVLVNAVKSHPDVDYTEAGLQILMDQLIKKMTIAQEEIDEMAPDKAGRLIVAISRTAAYKEKVKAELTKGFNKAFAKVKADLMEDLASRPELYEQVDVLVDKLKKKMELELKGEADA